MRARRSENVLVRRLADEAVAVVDGQAFVLDGPMLAVYEASDGHTDLVAATGLSQLECAAAVRRLSEAGLLERSAPSRRAMLVGAAGAAALVPLVSLALPSAAAATSGTTGSGGTGTGSGGGTPTDACVGFTPAVSLVAANPRCGTPNQYCGTSIADLTITGQGFPPSVAITFPSANFTPAPSGTTTDTSGGFTVLVPGASVCSPAVTMFSATATSATSATCVTSYTETGTAPAMSCPPSAPVVPPT